MMTARSNSNKNLKEKMNKEEMLTDLLEQGYTEEEALEKIEEYEEEQEHLAFFRFQEMNRQNNK